MSLTATLVCDEGFEPRPRRRHVHLHAQRLDNQLLGAWNGDRWRSRGSEGLKGHLVLAYCWKNYLLALILVSSVQGLNRSSGLGAWSGGLSSLASTLASGTGWAGLATGAGGGTLVHSHSRGKTAPRARFDAVGDKLPPDFGIARLVAARFGELKPPARPPRSSRSAVTLVIDAAPAPCTNPAGRALYG